MDFDFRLKQLLSKTKKGPRIQSINDGRRDLGDNLYDQRSAVIFGERKKAPEHLLRCSGAGEKSILIGHYYRTFTPECSRTDKV